MDKNNDFRELMKNPKTQLWRHLLMCYRMLYSLLDSSLQKNGTTLPRLQVLLVLYFEGPLVQVKLAKRLMVTRGNVSSLLKRMIEENLIQPTEAGGTASRPAYELASAGERILTEVLPQHIHNIEHLIPDGSNFEDSIASLQDIQTHLHKSFDVGVGSQQIDY